MLQIYLIEKLKEKLSISKINQFTNDLALFIWPIILTDQSILNCYHLL